MDNKPHLPLHPTPQSKPEKPEIVKPEVKEPVREPVKE